eukprot:TRINITY_DN14807_c0_g1_i1.p1 TRINITY_DN14807_c0_g1~~TRINITY_DN14807_c0_g1_i1.p1  ORF type:complete len:83 (+),score=28.66 TRINITY_DN14807_c0_g1_i1:36-251(+)
MNIDNFENPLADIGSAFKSGVNLLKGKRMSKPNSKEFSKTAKAAAVGVAIFGVVGFAVKLIHIPINNLLLN